MSVSTLTGTTWKFFDTHCQMGDGSFAIDFTIRGVSGSFNELSLGSYYDGSEVLPRDESAVAATSDGSVYVNVVSGNVITVTGGGDASTSVLITWFENNATLIRFPKIFVGNAPVLAIWNGNIEIKSFGPPPTTNFTVTLEYTTASGTITKTDYRYGSTPPMTWQQFVDSVHNPYHSGSSPYYEFGVDANGKMRRHDSSFGSGFALLTKTDGTSRDVLATETIDPTLYYYYEDASVTCLVADTLVTLADGSTKKIQDVGYDDLVLTYNPYLRKMVGEYPLFITETPDFCINHVRRFYLDDGNYLDVAASHTVLIDVSGKRHFYQLSAFADPEEMIGLSLVYADGSLHFITGCEDRPQDEGTAAYNVFVPMHGSVVANGIIASGDLLTTPLVAAVLYEDSDPRKLDLGLVDLASSMISTDEQLEADYTDFERMIGHEMPFRIFAFSPTRWYHALRRAGGSVYLRPEEIEGLVAALVSWQASYKPFPEKCLVKVGDSVTEVQAGKDFVVPDGATEYLDCSTFVKRKPGDRFRVFVSTVLEALDNE